MWRVIDIGGYGYFLSCSDNKLVVEKNGNTSEIPFRDISSIIMHGECKISSTVFTQCIANGIPITFCDDKHLPAGLFSAFSQNLESAKRFEIQVNAKRPRMKQAWMQIIREKLRNQAIVLSSIGFESEAYELYHMSFEVLSGDTTNREAVGAKIYFSTLFGNEFSRGDEKLEINGLLDYGYSIIRSLVARSVSAAGLYPGLSIFHSNRINPYALVDDLMEPLRAFSDMVVLKLIRNGETSVSPTVKRELIAMIRMETVFDGRRNELKDAVQSMVLSYVGFLDYEVSEILFPRLEDVCR